MSKAGCQGAAHTMGKVCPKAANLRGQVLCWAEKHCKHQEVKLLGVSAVKLTPSDKVGRVNQHEMAAVYAQLSSKWQEESKNRLPGFLSQKPLRGYCNLPVLTKSPCPNKSQCKPMKLGYWLILCLDVVHLHPYALAPHQFGPAYPILLSTDTLPNILAHWLWVIFCNLIKCRCVQAPGEEGHLMEGSGQITPDPSCEPKALNSPKCAES